MFCRRPARPGSPEQVILDENELARDQAYTFVGAFVPSPDHRYLAYAVDHTGAWVWDLFVKDLQTGLVVTDRIRGIARTAAWASDSRTLFYTSFNDSHRPHKVFRHVVGETPDQATEIHHEPDEDCYQFITLGVQRRLLAVDHRRRQLQRDALPVGRRSGRRLSGDRTAPA